MCLRIDDNDETICWSWERPDGGRSFESPDLGTLSLREPRVDLSAANVRDVVLMTRPESIRFGAASADAPVARVIERVPSGGWDEYVLRLRSGEVWRARVPAGTPRAEIGADVALDLRPDPQMIYPAPPRGPAKPASEDVA